MKYYEFYYSCGFPEARESKFYAFPDRWYEVDIECFFNEELENYAEKHINLISLPDPANYCCELSYEKDCDETFENWLDEIKIYSSFSQVDMQEWKDNNGEEIQ